MNDEDYYWNLTLRDGRVIPIPPKAIDVVKRKMATREPIITSESSIPFSLIQSFDKSSRRAGQQSLLEEVAQAFGEAIITQDEDNNDMVKARWVKKQVTNQEYASYYSKGHMYRKLGATDGGMVWVAFVVATHLMDSTKVEYCSREDIKQLTRK